MRELHGAIFLKPYDATPLLKQLALFFDKLHVLRAGRLDETEPEEQASFDFLESRGFLKRIPHSELERLFKTDAWLLDSLYGPEDVDDYVSRHFATTIGSGDDYDSVGIRLHPFPRPDDGHPVVPEPLKRFMTLNAEPSTTETTLSVAVKEFPNPERNVRMARYPRLQSRASQQRMELSRLPSHVGDEEAN